MMRGPPSVDVILPKFGFPSVTLLNTLKISQRASRCCEPIGKLRESARSTFQYPGPRRTPFCVLPHTPGVFGANAAVLNHAVSVGLLKLGSPISSGRCGVRPVSDRLPVV